MGRSYGNYSTGKKKDLESAKYPYLHISTKEFDELTKDYFLYVSATINRKKRKTAEFSMKYVQLIHVYHEYSRSLREGDLHGYISCLPKFTNMFFALNHPNYARWTVKYHNSLLTLEETHPETDADPDRLFNICTGKSYKKGTEDFLLNIESISNEARKSFIQECVENPNRFEDRIKKKKNPQFCNRAWETKKFEGLKGKLLKQTDKRLFWFNTVFVNGTKIDMAEVLKYPLTAVPLCLSHVHGSVNSTPK